MSGAEPHLHRVAELVGLALAHEVADGRGRDQHLVYRHEPATDTGHQPLRDHGRERVGELETDLALTIGREHVDDAVESLRRVVGVQRRQHEVAGLGERQRDRDALGIAHLTHEHDIGVFAERGA